MIGILGTGIQARLQARMHADVLDLEKVWIWGRTRERAEACRSELTESLGIPVAVAASPAEVARETRLIVTTTAARQPLLFAADVRPGTHISAVGSDSQGKQELDPAILSSTALLLVDSARQCQKLGELQHAPGEWERAVEIGTFCESQPQWDRGGITVCDFTGLGVEDLYIAEYCYQRL
jgi:ornithine cyclodeaminase